MAGGRRAIRVTAVCLDLVFYCLVIFLATVLGFGANSTFQSDGEVVLRALFDGAVPQGASAVVHPKRTRLVHVDLEVSEVTVSQQGGYFGLDEPGVEVVDSFDLARAVVDVAAQLAEASFAGGGCLFRRHGFFHVTEIRTSPREKSEEDGQRQKARSGASAAAAATHPAYQSVDHEEAPIARSFAGTGHRWRKPN